MLELTLIYFQLCNCVNISDEVAGAVLTMSFLPTLVCKIWLIFNKVSGVSENATFDNG